MNAITFEALGITKEELTEKLLDRLVEEFKTDIVWDEDGRTHVRASDISKQITQKIAEQIQESVKRLGDTHVVPRVNEIIEGLVIQKTNEWGEKKGAPVSFIEYLVKCAEDYMAAPVDLNGKTKEEAGGYSWSKSTTRVTHLVNSHLKYSIETAMKKALADANSQIVGGLEAAVKHALAEAQKKLSVSVKT